MTSLEDQDDAERRRTRRPLPVPRRDPANISCSCSSNINSSRPSIFSLSVYIRVRAMDFHIVFAQYFVFRLYDSALATIILKAT